ncbi:hypothetical protein LUZ61_011400 [Rhynchospora tenuis]|uniref:Uncharacterized protein n=1 Tax=Rhynchospora tenuis TaxID=198213 RepID=A0AAD6F0E4_9POAL|nr:hypothetical protein LUZ61_011400 [Rhynchospora tenuis]
MSLACLVCHGMDSPSHSFRSYSVSSSEGEGRCGAVVSCLTLKTITNNGAQASGITTSKVAPFPVITTGNQGVEGVPRLERSRAVSRDLVRDWNFDEIIFAS